MKPTAYSSLGNLGNRREKLSDCLLLHVIQKLFVKDCGWRNVGGRERMKQSEPMGETNLMKR